MTEKEIINLLALIAAFDQRTVGRADILAWHSVALDEHWNYQHAERAVRDYHRRNGDKRRINPAHVTDAIGQARATIRRQLLKADLTPPRDLADNPAAEIAWRRETTAELVERGMHAWATGQPLAALEAS